MSKSNEEKFPFKIDATPWTENLFKIDEGSIKERDISHIGDEEYFCVREAGLIFSL